MNRKVVVLQLLDRALYKTVGSSIGQYLGDPVNVLAHFSEFESNEVLIMDISSSSIPDFEFLKLLGRHCSMPLSYVGKVKSLDDVARIISLGFERVLIGDAIFEDASLLEKSVSAFGCSTMGVIVNYEFKDGKRYVWRKGVESTSYELTAEWLSGLANASVGEILLYCISADGKRKGYDLGVLDLCPSMVNINLCGGCSSISELERNLSNYPKISFSAGSSFSLLPNNSVFLKYSKDLK